MNNNVSPSWYIYYTLRLYDTLRTCPYRPFLYVYPITSVDTPIHCLVYSTKLPQSYKLNTTCIQRFTKKGESMIQHLHKSIYDIASHSHSVTQQLSVPFEQQTQIKIWTTSTPKVSNATSNKSLIHVSLQIDTQHPPTSNMHFDTQEQCNDIVTYFSKIQQTQYRTSKQQPLLVSNPRFAQIPVDQWYPSFYSPLFMIYDQLNYTAGDWNDLWLHAMFTSYTKMQHPNIQSQAKTRPRVREVMQHITQRYLDTHSPYVNLSPETTLNTLQYVFQKQQKGVFIRIKNNTLDTFLPFVRQNFTNDYYTKLHLPQW